MSIKSGKHNYIHLNRIFNEMIQFRVALCLHGHGACCGVGVWGRFFVPLHRAGFRVVALDAPCFGRSSGPTGQANLWRADDAELVLRLLRVRMSSLTREHRCTLIDSLDN